MRSKILTKEDKEMKRSMLQFTEKEWEEEMKKSYFCRKHWPTGSCTMPCPNCKTVGFYGPRGREDESGNVPRKYRACKFCGFWQEAFGPIYDERGGKPYRCVMVKCFHCHTHDYAYDWRLPWQDDWGECEDCKSKLKQVSWPTEDPTHPFHQWKVEMIRIHNFLNSQ